MKLESWNDINHMDAAILSPNMYVFPATIEFENESFTGEPKDNSIIGVEDAITIPQIRQFRSYQASY